MNISFLDLVGMIYKSFHEGNMRSCKKIKDLGEDRRRTASMYLETFYRVLPLLVETRGHLLLLL